MATRYGNDGEFHAAASKVMMRPGRHFVQFTVAEGIGMIFGAILLRPSWDVQGGERAEDEEGHCLYYTYSGERDPGNRDWEGRYGAREQGDVIGMLLDLDQVHHDRLLERPFRWVMAA